MSETYLNNVESVIKEKHLFDLLANRFREHSADTALVEADKSWTYGELLNEVDRVSVELMRRGLRLNDRVAMCAPPSARFVIVYLASISIGCVWMGVNPKYTARELSYILTNSNPKLLFVYGVDTERFADFNDISIVDYLEFHDSLNELTREDAETLAARRRLLSKEPGLPALLIYTSGSTGSPKGALVSAAALARIAIVQSERWNLEKPSFICNLPINHIGCVGDLITVALYAGARIHFMLEFDPGKMLQLIKNKQITGLFQIPTQLIRVADHPDFNPVTIQSLELVGWGGAALPIRYIRRFRELGLRMKTVYGSTETVASVTYSPEDATDEQLANTVGKPDPGLDVQILPNAAKHDSDFAREFGIVGEVCIRHWTTLPGYIGDKQASDNSYTSTGYLKTGDLGRLRNDGMLELVGRTKDMYKSGGYNVYPREIELVIESNPAVVTAAVVAVPHHEYSEVGAAFVKLDMSDSSPDASTPTNGEAIEKIRRQCRENLANYKVPKSFHILEEFPYLANGKIDKIRLQKLAIQLIQGTQYE